MSYRYIELAGDLKRRRKNSYHRNVSLKGHSHEKVLEIIPVNHRLGPN
jgi:hypothetical protein